MFVALTGYSLFPQFKVLELNIPAPVLIVRVSNLWRMMLHV